MLVLSRGAGECIRIGQNVVIQIVGINRGKVRIGIDAPRDVQVVRKELLYRNTPNPKMNFPTRRVVVGRGVNTLKMQYLENE